MAMAVVAFLALAVGGALASDPTQLQDFCVAEKNTDLFVNGFLCKDPKKTTAEDFSFSGLDKPGNTENRLGLNVTVVNAANLPGLNTLGVGVGRIDYAPYGLNPPHTHPRATEVLTVLEGDLFVGFVTSAPGNLLIAKVLHRGDVFVFPQGLVHFQQNVGKEPTVAMVAFGSQNPGLVVVADTLFGSKPPITDDVLERAFGVGKEVIDEIRAKIAG